MTYINARHFASVCRILSFIGFCGFLYGPVWTYAPGPDGDDCTGRGTVYIVQTIDTEAQPIALVPYTANLNLFDFLPGQLVDRVTSGAGRSTFRDSFGQTAVYTWLLLSDEFYCASTGGDCAAVYTVMEPYIDQARNWGDAIGWHYHNLGWSDLNGDGRWFWNQLQTFNGTTYGDVTDRSLAEKILAYVVIEKRFYPSLFRSGWGWENNDFSIWLDDIVPFDFSNFSPLRYPQRRPDSIDNVYDWSRAPRGWSYYHPDPLDYQVPGNMQRYIFRTSNDFGDFERAFATADSGRDQMIVTYTHSYNDGDGLDYSMFWQELQSRYHCVPFKFVSALEGARAILGLSDTAQPNITVNREFDRFRVVSDKPLYSFPYGAAKTADGRYLRILPTNPAPEIVDGEYEWVYDLALYTQEQSSLVFSVAGTTAAGSTFVSDQYVLGSQDITTADESAPPSPGRFSLAQNRPNPFNNATEIRFALREAAHVTVAVYNILGQLVVLLVDDELPAGEHAAFWDGTDSDGRSAASGIYFYRLEAPGFSDSREMILIK